MFLAKIGLQRYYYYFNYTKSVRKILIFLINFVIIFPKSTFKNSHSHLVLFDFHSLNVQPNYSMRTTSKLTFLRDVTLFWECKNTKKNITTKYL